MTELAPIVLFTYSRPVHAARLLDSLAANAEAGKSRLYIYCDGPKQDASAETLQKIKETREIARNEKRFKEVFVIEQEKNKGLADSIIDGVTEVINQYERVIVLEDDLILSPYLLFYMNDSLKRYEHNNRVGQIGACNFFACGKQFPSSFFIPIPDCLGWGTWKNRWACFNKNAQQLFREIEDKKLLHKFNAYGSYDMSKLLRKQITGDVSSWAILWTAVCIVNNWLTLYPNPALTNHIASVESTHANIDIMPPMPRLKPNFKTVEVLERPEVIKAMILAYGGTGNYYGNSTTKINPNTLFRLLSFVSRKVVYIWRSIA
jgi:hypothetical protein